MLKLSVAASITKALFFRHRNEFDIYYEDNNDEEFYKIIISKVLGNKYKVEKLISLGNRANVLAACMEDQIDLKRKRLYIIDGDIDLINGTNPSNLKFLHIHPAYCIENLLIDEEAIIEVIHDFTEVSKERIKKKLRLNSFFKEVSPYLIDLFLHYALVVRYKLGIKTVSITVDAFCKQTGGHKQVDKIKIQSKIDELAEKLVKVIGEEKYTEEIDNLRTIWKYDIATLLKIVSAKDYLLPLIHYQFRKVSVKATSCSRDNFRFRLAKLTPLKNFSELQKSFLKA